MIFRQLFDPDTSTFSYLPAAPESREAVIIDPVLEQVDRDAALVDSLGVRLVCTLDTHVHADHVTGASALRDRLGCLAVVSEAAGVSCSDQAVGHGEVVRFGGYGLQVRATPGHTAGCVSFVTLDETMVFTGDALLIGGCGRTDFQEGDARTLYRRVHEQIFTLPDATRVYPGHDYKGRTVSTVGDEKRHNARLGHGRSEGDFIALMNGLGLPYPKRIDVALPANRACGATATGLPIVLTGAGIPEVDPVWIAANAARVRLIDIREPAECCGPLGCAPDAQRVPLGKLADAASEWSTDDRIALICHSGRRSAEAAQRLRTSGFSQIASVSGGMQAWTDRGLPVVRASVEGEAR